MNDLCDKGLHQKAQVLKATPAEGTAYVEKQTQEGA